MEQRSLKQWFLRITEYGDRLLDDLDKVSSSCSRAVCTVGLLQNGAFDE